MKIVRNIGSIWGILGVLVVLIGAITRLTPRATETIQAGLTNLQYTALISWCVFMLATEGYGGFQKQLSPRVVARAQYIHKQGSFSTALFAPLFCLSFFGATKKRLIVSYGLSLAIALFVLIARQLPAPWRGIIDTGVVLGLIYGAVWIIIYAIRALRNAKYVADPEI